MSALADRPATESACSRCGARLKADQDWCLECGAMVESRIRAAPDWRVPAAIVGGIVALVAAGLVFALVTLSNSANRSVAAANAAASSTPATTAPSTTTPSTAAHTTAASTPATIAPATTVPTSPAISSWPAGVTGFTVILDVNPDKATETAKATKVAAAGIPVGILKSSDFSSMRPGDWIVFSGTYTTKAQAEVAATALHAKGQPGAYEFSVIPAAP